MTLAAERTLSTDVFLRHKTTHRPLYDRLFAAAQRAGFDEVLFLNQRDEVTEGAISNIFVRIEGRLYTPPLACGVLPGVFRRHLLEAVPRAEERILKLADLAPPTSSTSATPSAAWASAESRTSQSLVPRNWSYWL